MKATILRGKILSLLNDLYPDGAEQTTIIGIFYQRFKVDDIIKSLQYLCDKDYVKKSETAHPYKANCLVYGYKILPAGIEIGRAHV